MTAEFRDYVEERINQNNELFTKNKNISEAQKDYECIYDSLYETLNDVQQTQLNIILEDINTIRYNENILVYQIGMRDGIAIKTDIK